MRLKIIVVLLLCSSGIFAQTKNLDYYINLGLKNSPLLKDYGNQINSAGFDSSLVAASFKPQVNLTSNATYYPGGKNFGYDTAITNGGNYSALVGINQPLLNAKAKKTQFHSTLLNRQTLQLNSRISEIDLKKEITAEYLSAYSDYQQIQFTKSLLQLLQQEQAEVKQLVDKGVYLQTDYLNLSASIKAQDINISEGFIQFKNDLAALNLICGIVDTSGATLSAPDISLNNAFDVNSSPVMMQFKVDSLKNGNSKLLVDLNYRPKLNAFADAGFMSVNPENIPHNFGASIGLNFVLPIYDGNQRKLQYQKISLLENSRANYRDFYITQYTQQEIQLREKLRLTDELIGQINSQITDQQNLIELYKAEINKGLVRFLDFITVVNNYAATKNSLTQAEMNRLQLIIQLNYLK
jgi:outer membrane protein TolC